MHVFPLRISLKRRGSWDKVKVHFVSSIHFLRVCSFDGGRICGEWGYLSVFIGLSRLLFSKKAKQYVEHRFWVNLSHCRLAWSLSLLIERGSHVKYTQKCSHSPLTGSGEWHFQITRKSETFESRLNLFNLASDRWALTAHVQSKTVKVMDSWLFFNGSLMPLSQRSVQIIHHHELICRHGEWAQMSHEK